jgi:O-acetyl-ADP-ribose deacetylase (regulator of RNase III)
MRITAIRGNILRQPDCDGIVNSANEHLIAGGGVCGAIYKAAGPELEPYTRKLAPLALGEAIVSPGFKLDAKWIVHARGPRYYEDEDPPRNLRSALASAIRLADVTGVRKLAVPAISTGIYGYPVADAATILIGAARQLSRAVGVLVEVRFVLIDDAAHQAFLIASGLPDSSI